MNILILGIKISFDILMIIPIIQFFLLKHKYDFFEIFRIYKLEVENQFNKK
jgi:hypothetical protein